MEIPLPVCAFASRPGSQNKDRGGPDDQRDVIAAWNIVKDHGTDNMKDHSNRIVKVRSVGRSETEQNDYLGISRETGPNNESLGLLIATNLML